MRAALRLLTWRVRLRAPWRRRAVSAAPSQQDFAAFALNRYSPEQQREIARLIARKPVVSRRDIADALSRADRRTRLTGQLTGFATGVGFVAMFTLGIVVAKFEAPQPGNGAPLAIASAPPAVMGRDDHWSPGGLDEADRQFFAELQAGQTPSAAPAAPAPPRPSPAVAPAPAPILAASARPRVPPATDDAAQPGKAVIQLGAFGTADVARARWKSMADRYAELRSLTRAVAPIVSGGHMLYRLQASGADAAEACPGLTAAGETCVVITPAVPSAAAPALAAANPRPAAPPSPPASARHETVIQLGAFADAAVAKARWEALATRFPSLRPLTQTVSPVARGGRKIYRLRASGIDAASACSALAVAGATCFVATDA